MDLGTAPLLKQRNTEIIPKAARCSEKEERENRQCLRGTSIHTHTHATLGPLEREREREKQSLSFRQPAGGSILQALLGRMALHRAQKIHLHMSCLTIIIIQKGLLFIWLPSSTQSWCISQALSDLPSPQLCTTKRTTSSRVRPSLSQPPSSGLYGDGVPRTVH